MKEKRSIKEIIRREKRLLAMGAEPLCQCDFAHDNGENPEATGFAFNYAAHFAEMKEDGTGLFLFGGPGAGKSYMAAEIVNELTDRGYKCRFTSLLSILGDLSTLSWENRRSYLNQVCDQDLLVLALSRLLSRSRSYTALMPGQRRRHMREKLQKADALLRGEGYDSSHDMDGMDCLWEPCEETTVLECLPEPEKSTKGD